MKFSIFLLFLIFVAIAGNIEPSNKYPGFAISNGNFAFQDPKPRNVRDIQTFKDASSDHKVTFFAERCEGGPARAQSLPIKRKERVIGRVYICENGFKKEAEIAAEQQRNESNSTVTNATFAITLAVMLLLWLYSSY